MPVCDVIIRRTDAGWTWLLFAVVIVIAGAMASETVVSATTRSPGAVHLLEFGQLFRGQHGFIAVLIFSHQVFKLFGLLLREQVVVVTDRLCLGAETLLVGFQLSDLVISQVEPEFEPFEVTCLCYLDILGSALLPGGQLLFLLRGDQGLQFSFLFFVKGDQLGLILTEGEIIVLEEIGCLFTVVGIDGGYLPALFRRIVDTVASFTAPASVCETIVTEAAPLASAWSIGPSFSSPGTSKSVAGPESAAMAAEAISFGQAVAAIVIAPMTVHTHTVGGIR